MRQRLCGFIVGLSTLFLFLPSPLLASDGVTLTSCKVLRVTGNPFYPPALWASKKNNNKLVGLAVEFLETALEPTGIEVNPINSDTWARAQVQARSGAVDMLAGAFITEERQTYMDYVQPPFMVMPSVVWVRKGAEFPYSTWSDLKGKHGVTLIDNSFGQSFDEFSAQNLEVMGVRSAEQIFQLISARRVDYGLYELYQGKAMGQVSPVLDDITYLLPAISSEGLYFTLSKSSPCRTPQLKLFLDERVKTLVESGLAEKLANKYLERWRDAH